MILIVRVVQHGVVMCFVDARYGADVSRHAGVRFHMFAAVYLEQLADLDRLARIADEELVAGLDRALVNTEDGEPPFERIDIDLEHMSDCVSAHIGRDGHFLNAIALTFEKHGRIALGRVRHQALEDLQQLVDTGTRRCRDEAHRDEVLVAQCFFERVVQLLRLQFLSLLEIDFHELVIDFDNLVDDLRVRGGYVAERCFIAFGLEEAVDDLGTVGGWEIQWQALAAERRADVVKQEPEVHAFGVDLVNDDHTTKPLIVSGFHHASSDLFDSRLGVDYDRSRFDSGKDR